LWNPWIDLGWLVFYAAWGAAALHPYPTPAADAEPEPRSGPGYLRVIPFTVAALALPAVYFVRLAQGGDAPGHTMALASIPLYALAGTRIAMLLRQTTRDAAALRSRGDALDEALQELRHTQRERSRLLGVGKGHRRKATIRLELFWHRDDVRVAAGSEQAQCHRPAYPVQCGVDDRHRADGRGAPPKGEHIGVVGLLGLEWRGSAEPGAARDGAGRSDRGDGGGEAEALSGLFVVRPEGHAARIARIPALLLIARENGFPLLAVVHKDARRRSHGASLGTAEHSKSCQYAKACAQPPVSERPLTTP